MLFAAVAVLAGTLLVLTGLMVKALAENDSSAEGAGLMIGLGIAAVVFGSATVAFAWAGLGAAAVLAVAFYWAYSGRTADADTLYEAFAGVALLLLGALALVRSRGGQDTAEDLRASAGAPAPPAPNGAPSTPGAEPPRRTPPS